MRSGDRVARYSPLTVDAAGNATQLIGVPPWSGVWTIQARQSCVGGIRDQVDYKLRDDDVLTVLDPLNAARALHQAASLGSAESLRPVLPRR